MFSSGVIVKIKKKRGESRALGEIVGGNFGLWGRDRENVERIREGEVIVCC